MDRLSSTQAFLCASFLGATVTLLSMKIFAANTPESAKDQKSQCTDQSYEVGSPNSKKVKLYGDPQATCTRKVIQLFEEKNFSFDFQIISLKEMDQKDPEYMKKQPFGRVPLVEVSDGFSLYESQAIIRYFNEVLTGYDIIPKTPVDRANMEKWISIYSSYFKSPQHKIYKERTLKTRYERGGPCDEDIVKSAVIELEPILDVMEKQLATTKYLACEEFTLADLLFGPDFGTVASQNEVEELICKRENVRRWWNLVKGRPAYIKACEYHKLTKKAAKLV
mmetsp:Transcript_33238/g.43803  ORF Transcript_33238/g.43803 Transcript_33238/m.43803 type:complete len:279 (-) Transcript_33238:285-1121(-)